MRIQNLKEYFKAYKINSATRQNNSNFYTIIFENTRKYKNMKIEFLTGKNFIASN